MTDQPAHLSAPRQPAESWLDVASDRAEGLGVREVTVQLAIGEALVRIADHLEELLDELREQRVARTLEPCPLVLGCELRPGHQGRCGAL